VGGLVSAQVAETKWNHPHISPPFQALVPEMARCAAISGDFGRLRLAFGRRRGYGRSLRLPSSHNPAAWRYGSTWHPR
jgi:hypothetical protein